MKLNEIINIEHLNELIEKGYISRKFHNDYPLAILNYSKLAEYDDKLIWDNEMNVSRGLIYETTRMNIIARPFSKFWNISDNRHPETIIENLPKEQPLFLEKLDGSLGIVFEYDGLNHVATRGSFHSDQAVWATNWIRNHYQRLSLPKNNTVCVEILFKENKIVVDYDFEACIVLGIVNISSGKEWCRNDVREFCRANDLQLVKEYRKTLTEILKENERNREGYVLTYPSSGFKIKCKFENYFTLHHILSGLSVWDVWDLLRKYNYSSIDDLFYNKQIPNTFKIWLKQLFERFVTDYRENFLKTEVIFKNKPNTTSRKEISFYFNLPENKKYARVLFLMLDNKSISDIIWKMIEPKGNEVFVIDEK